MDSAPNHVGRTGRRQKPVRPGREAERAAAGPAAFGRVPDDTHLTHEPQCCTDATVLCRIVRARAGVLAWTLHGHPHDSTHL
jgi:hypothetical protein